MFGTEEDGIEFKRVPKSCPRWAGKKIFLYVNGKRCGGLELVDPVRKLWSWYGRTLVLRSSRPVPLAKAKAELLATVSR